MMAISASTHTGDEGADPVGKVASSIAAADAVLTLGGHELPLVDAAVLQDLEEQLGQPDIARNFANDYAAMLGQRQRRLVASVGREDRAAALDAVISLKVSSAMVGGLRLAHLAERLEAAVREGDLQDGAAQLAVIAINGRATVKQLQLRYIRPYG